MTDRTLIIAEAGVNHNGDPALAHKLVDVAADAGADVVKFQTFRADALATSSAPKAGYQMRTTDGSESQLEMLRRLELSHEEHHRLVERCRARNIRFLSTPFDLGSLAFLTRGLKVDTLKIGSGDLTNAPLLLAAARDGVPVILSTGMATMEEIEAALAILAFGYSASTEERPTRQAFVSAFGSPEGQAALKARATLLHCTSEYPSAPEDANLRAMNTMRKAFSLPVGLSDHTPGVTVAVGAVALGARIIEKHLTLDTSLPGPDHAASLDPAGFRKLVRSIRTVEAALGDGEKHFRPSEAGNRATVRKSLVASQPIAEGESFTTENLSTLRPGQGITALEYFDWLGRQATQAYSAGDIVKP